MFVPDYLSANAFRVLGLAADASLADAHRAVATMTRCASLGETPPMPADSAELGDLNRSVVDLRMALGRIQNPSQRLRDRLFWFQAQQPFARVSDSETDVAKSHDRALHSLVRAMRADPDDAGMQAWHDAMRSWHASVGCDDYWELFSQWEEQGAFEPAALRSEVEALRHEAVQLAAEGLLMRARAAYVAEDLASLRRIALTLMELETTGRWAERAVADLAAAPAAELQSACERAVAEFTSKIDRSSGKRKANARLCKAANEHFRSQVEPALARVLSFVPLLHPVAVSCREEAALCLASMAADETWAEHFERACALQQEAVAMAHNTVSLLRLEQTLTELERLRRAQAMRLAEEAATPAVADLRRGCLKLHRMLKTILREQDAVQHNKGKCAAAQACFDSDVRPPLARIERQLEPDHPALIRCRQGAADCLAQLASALTWAEDFVAAEQRYAEALRLVQHRSDREAILHALKGVETNARRQRLFDALRPLSSAPSLRIVNFVGFALYGEDEPDMPSRSYVTTHYFVILLLPIIPLARYRVIRQGESGYRFLGRLPLSRSERWHQAIGIVACVALFILLVANSNGSHTR